MTGSYLNVTKVIPVRQVFATDACYCARMNSDALICGVSAMFIREVS
jgi:hypothetical protein